MALTDTVIKNSRFSGKQIKITDEKGMYLLVSNSGKYFRMDYRFGGKRKTLAIGVYPETSLKEARIKRDNARKLLSDNIDPMEVKKTKKQSIYEDSTNNFYSVACEWYEKFKPKWSEKHAEKKWRFLEKDIFPYVGSKPIKNITAKDILTLLERIQNRGAIDIAHRINGICGEIFLYGIRTNRCENNPTSGLTKALTPKVNKHMACITEPSKLKGLLLAIENYEGEIVTRHALKLAPYVFLRPGELRQAEWSEIDLGNAIWKIPAGKMKMKKPHMIPLSKQVVQIFKDIMPLTGRWKYVFPSLRSKDRPMSDNTLNAALRRMGFTKEEMTAHGFRGVASTLLHENGFNSLYIETQLAHSESNKVKAAYNHAEYMEERTNMMQWWADYLDEVKNGYG